MLSGSYWLVALPVIFYASFVTRAFTFAPYYCLYPDAVSMYALQRIHDPSLFTRDLFCSRAWGHHMAMPGGSICEVYRFLMNAMPLQLAQKMVSILGCLAGALMIYRVGTRLVSRDYAAALTSLFLACFLSMDTFYGGSPRTFGAVLVVGLLSCMIEERFTFLPLFVPLMMVFYPVLTAMVAITVAIVFAVYYPHLRERGLVRIYLAVAAAALVVSAVYLGYLASQGPGLEPANIFIFQRYKYTQRVGAMLNPHELPGLLLFFILNFNEHSRLNIILMALLLALAVAIVASRKWQAFGEVPTSLWVLLAASALAFPFAFAVHPPSGSRQFVLTLPLWLVFFVAGNLFRLAALPRRLLVAAPLAVFLALHPILNDNESYQQYSPVYDYVRALPKDALVSGYPESRILYTLPLMAQRAVFYADQFSDLYAMVSPGKEMSRRRDDNIAAVFARSRAPVVDFIRRHGVDYFIVERNNSATAPQSVSGRPLMVNSEALRQTYLYRFALKKPAFVSTSKFSTVYLVRGADILASAREPTSERKAAL